MNSASEGTPQYFHMLLVNRSKVTRDTCTSTDLNKYQFRKKINNFIIEARLNNCLIEIQF